MQNSMGSISSTTSYKEIAENGGQDHKFALRTNLVAVNANKVVALNKAYNGERRAESWAVKKLLEISIYLEI